MSKKILMALMGLDIGGAETHVVELSKELLRRGFDVLVISNGGVYEEELEQAGARCFHAPLNVRKPLPMLRSLLALRRLIRDEKPDVVHAHARIPAFLCGILHRRMGFPFVTSAHWVFTTEGLLGKLTNWGEQTVAVSDDIRDYLKDNYGIPDENIIVTINGIDTERFSPEISGEKVLAEFGFSAARPVISYVSRMDESRALVARQLVAIAPRLRERIEGLQLIIAGGGDAYDDIKAKADAANEAAGEVYIAMPGARTDINEIAAAGDLFVGVSRSALEAMAAEKPVIVAGNEGYIGLFDESRLQISRDTNFCCRGCEESSEKLLERDILRAMLGLSADDRKALGSYGRSVINEYYSVGRMAADCEEAYRRVLASHTKVVVSGYYGFRNLGDDSILLALKEDLQRACPGATLTALSKRPAETKERCGIQAVDRFSPFAVRKAIKSCSCFVSGGGSLLQDHTSTRSLLYYTWLIRMAWRFGKPIMFYANGIGPVSDPKNRERVREVSEMANIITLRDSASCEELRSMGVRNENVFVTADPVYAVGKGDPGRGRTLLEERGIDPGKRLVGVSVRFAKGMEMNREAFARFCDEVSNDAEIVFIDMQQPADGEASAAVKALMKSPAREIDSPYSPQDLMDMIACMDAVVSTRLHSMIFAACSGVPALGIDYDPKVRACAESLGMPLIGTLSDFDPASAAGDLRTVLSERESYAHRIRAASEELSAKAAENNRLFRELIS
ncbi:MAG: polysaccharide pyruvyl transferase CsaB [Firmicutes bacterium]|nr:polysaccharide pyruvyl transferase CsaB [Bacillota bacterium]